jgi:thiol-disulfide isomerase/thioredoxin
MFDRTHLLVIALAIGGALAGLFVGAWLRPSAPVANRASSELVGTPRPPVELPDLAGQRQSLAQWDGKLIVLNFWASWCAPCVEEMPLLDRAQHRLAGRGVQVIGIASDGVAATRDFLAAHPVGYPILVEDPDALAPGAHDLSVTYGNSRNVLPYSVLIGRDGRILAQRFGNFSESGLEQWLAPHL